MSKFVTSFWNYVPSGVIDAEKSVDDWAELGMNLPMTCYCEKDEDYEYILKNLDAAAKKGMKLIICDKRTLRYDRRRRIPQTRKSRRGQIRVAPRVFCFPRRRRTRKRTLGGYA